MSDWTQNAHCVSVTLEELKVYVTVAIEQAAINVDLAPFEFGYQVLKQPKTPS